MNRFNTVADLRQYLRPTRFTQSIGLIPTMGALHAGHLALVEKAKNENNLIIASIFVNPVQFNNPDDLARYPRTLEDDCRQLEAAGCDAVFAPSVEEIYPEKPRITLNFGELETVMEGAFRPGHFNGVGIVVAKLFNIVQPDRAYFGQKDLQQVAVVRRLVQDLSFPLELVRCPTLREADGLAMSSRNRNLTADERAQAPALFRVLSVGQGQLEAGQPVKQVKADMLDNLRMHPEFRVEYVDIVHTDTVQPVTERQEPGKTAICVAAHLGKVRLIDNVVF